MIPRKAATKRPKFRRGQIVYTNDGRRFTIKDIVHSQVPSIAYWYYDSRGKVYGENRLLTKREAGR